MKKKVAIIFIGLDSLGGAERRIASLTHFLQEEDTEISFIVNQELLQALSEVGLRPHGRTIVLKGWHGRAVDRLKESSLVSWLYSKVLSLTSHVYLSFQLGLVLLWLRPHVIQLLSVSTRRIFFPYLYICPAAKIVSLVGTETRDYRSANPLDKRLLSLYLSKANLVDVLSEELFDLVIKQRLAPEHKIRINGSFVETDEFRPANPKLPWVVFASRFIDEKNPLLFIEAISMVLMQYPGDVHFYILGSGPLEGEIRQRLVELGIQERVSVKFAKNIGDILQHSQIFCSLQTFENYPSRSLLEAMACGNAIVATDVGYTYKLVGKENGIRVLLEPSAVADAIVDLLQSPDTLVSFGQRSRDLVVDQYSPERYAKRLLKIYDEVLSNPVDSSVAQHDI